MQNFDCLSEISSVDLEHIVSDTDVFFEGMTSISSLIDSIKKSISDRIIKLVLVDKEKLHSKHRDIKFLHSCSEKLGFKLFVCDSSLMNLHTTGTTHGGIIALCSQRTIPHISNGVICDNGFFAYMEGIEDPYNFGYSIRSLYAAGVDGIVMPERNWMQAAGTVARSSAGTSEMVPMYYGDVEDIGKLFHSKGYKIVTAAIRDSIPLYDADMTKPLLLIVGGEKRGISRRLLEISDLNVRIEYANAFRGSLPTVSAVSVMAFEIYKQNR